MARRVLDRLRLGDQEVSIILVSDRAMKRLNTDYRGKPRTTDVLSFADSGIEGYLGDVFISMETAAASAAGRGHSLRRETALLTLHGLLHLAGYDHETDDGRMQRLERRLRRIVIPWD